MTLSTLLCSKTSSFSLVMKKQIVPLGLIYTSASLRLKECGVVLFLLGKDWTTTVFSCVFSHSLSLLWTSSEDHFIWCCYLLQYKNFEINIKLIINCYQYISGQIWDKKLSFDFQYDIEIKHEVPLWQRRLDPLLPLFASNNHSYRKFFNSIAISLMRK